MIVFRCDASPELGFGHLMRCRILAEALHERGERCVMVGPDASYAKPEDSVTFIDWVPVKEWHSSELEATRLVEIARKYRASWLVLDDYRVNEAFQLLIRAAGLEWLQFDGHADKPLWADIVVNANPAMKQEEYQAVLHNKEAKLLLGPKFAMLRKEFREVKQRDSSRLILRVLVTFGGGDDRGAIEFVLTALMSSKFSEMHFLVISGASNPNNDVLKKWVVNKGQDRVVLHIDPANIASLYSSCDIALMAGGTSVYEALRCDVYPLIISIADNQRLHSKAWAEMKCAKYLGDYKNLDKDLLVNAVQQVISSTDRVSCSSLVDGKGAMRIAELIK